MTRLPFKLLLCASDEPGSLLLMLKKLNETFDDNHKDNDKEIKHINIDSGGKYHIEPSIHMFTLKRCERFIPIYSQDVYIGNILYMRPKYGFHFVLELYLKEKDNKEDIGDRRKIAVMEVHMCINGHYYGVPINTMRNIVEAFAAPLCDGRRDQKYVFCPSIILDNKDNKDKILDNKDNRDKDNNNINIIRYGLLIFPDDKMHDALLYPFYNTLIKLTSSRENENTCAVRATCPLAHVRINENRFKELYGRDFLKYRLITGGINVVNNNKNNYSVPMQSMLFINFARDHECYVRNTTFTEYYGVLSDDSREITGNTNKVNAMIICIHYMSKDSTKTSGLYNVVVEYIKAVLRKLNIYNDNNNQDYIIINLDDLENVFDNQDKCLYVYYRFFTCDDIRCELVQRSLPSIAVGV